MECFRAGLTPEEAIRLSVSNSTEAFCIRVNHEIVALWGYRAAPLGALCQGWLLSTPIAEKWEYRFAKSSLRITAHLLKRYEEIRVVVDLEHKKAIEWLSWLGFVPHDKGDLFMEMSVTKETASWAF